MIRPAVLAAVRDGEVDLAFRRWERPRVRVGTRLRTAVGLVEVTSLEQVAASSLTAADAARAGAASVAELRDALAGRPGPVWRIGLAHAGPDPREALRATVPTEAEVVELRAWLDRLDRASSYGAWTRQALALIDEFPGRRAPELAEIVGRPTPEFKTDVRKLKEKGLTESLDIGYRLSVRGAAVLGVPPPEVGHPAAEGRRARLAGPHGRRGEDARAGGGVVARRPRRLHGVGPVALERLRAALGR